MNILKIHKIVSYLFEKIQISKELNIPIIRSKKPNTFHSVNKSARIQKQ